MDVNINQFKTIIKSRIANLIVLILTVNNFYWIFQNIFSFKFNEDEFQHTHIAWNISQGLILYKDFWEHHGPLYSLLNAFFFSILKNPADINTLFLLRTISFSSSIITLVFIFLISYNILNKNLFFSCLSLFIYSSWTVVIQMAFQIRPDILQNTFMLIGIFATLKALDDNKIELGKFQIISDAKIKFFFAGLAFGLMLMFNFKSIIIILALGISFIIDGILQKNLKSVKSYSIILLGIISTSLIVSIYFFQNNAFQEFIEFSILNNFKMISERAFPELAKFLLIKSFFDTNLLLTSLTILATLSINFKNQKHLSLAIIFIFSLYGTFKGLYLHYCLIYLPICSILISIFLYRIIFSEIKIFQMNLNKECGFILIALLIFSGTQLAPTISTDIELQKEIINWTLKNLQRDDVVLSTTNECPSFIFNKDYNKRSPYNGALIEIDTTKISVIGILNKDHIPDNISRYFKTLKINDEDTCLMIKKNHTHNNQENYN